MAFKFIFLTQQFYADYMACPEIEQKPDRPYVQVVLRIDDIDFAIPMRSHIKHPNAYITDEKNLCGLDYSKAIVLVDPARYIDISRKPRIRQNEFDALRGKEYIVEQGMRRYLKLYHRALLHPEIPRNAMLLRYSTLQYFEEHIILVND